VHPAQHPAGPDVDQQYVQLTRTTESLTQHGPAAGGCSGAGSPEGAMLRDPLLAYEGNRGPYTVTVYLGTGRGAAATQARADTENRSRAPEATPFGSGCGPQQRVFKGRMTRADIDRRCTIPVAVRGEVGSCTRPGVSRDPA
jgi:hypothetical protein